jgi:hypothetical protein
MIRRCVRFDVTPYADMHPGHVWPAWRAYQLSRRLGFDFLLQFDDDAYTRRNLWHQSWSLETSMQRFAEDFAWLGIPPDRATCISEHAEAERSRCAYCRSAWRADASGVCKSCGAPPQLTRHVLPDWDDIPAGETQERAGY